ncbi:ppGpp synthetase catalytic domain-containing protein (RelA/SpoT-type nucleotidyltranferase) [Ancylobacter rudongensis]|uniref:PpGpp synthetase catalytic domain-containing protein (RelA/SpoT-type nucleotidyltranferase) n=2 Tax=Ancylobacter rudongensis TaxID=177413 RepID=A0A1G4PUF6_9HYPH|nr:ppGpp synthetase catalytic domain-containing protein (RelA/SpoT-type nucleotidyltranferase) [Ancylobacter rudongensis]
MAKKSDSAPPSPPVVTNEDSEGLFEQKKNEFKEHYAKNLPLYSAAEKSFRNLIQQLTDISEVQHPKVISRLKERDECIKKFSLKYRNEAENTESYKISDYITDIIGVRIVCLYETDMPKIENIIKENFDIISITDKTKLLVGDIRTFGYKGVHFDIKLRKDRYVFPEYKRLEGVQVEVQLRSIVQDAWSEIEHKLRYKKQSPPLLQRRVVRLAALFELADQEFSTIRDETERLEAQAQAESKKEEPAKGSALDSFSFLAMMSKFHPNYRFDAQAIDGFVDEIKQMDQNFTLDELSDATAKYRKNVWDYKQHRRSIDVNINPFTEFRHILYAHDKKRFENMLYPNQRRAFLDWLAEQDLAI